MEQFKELRHIKTFRMIVFSLILILPIEIISLLGIHIPLVIEICLFLIVAFLFGKEIFLSGFKSLIRGKFSDINVLMIIAILGAVYLRQFPEATIIIVLFSLGELLEHYGVSKSKKAIENLVSSLPKQAFVKDKGAMPIEKVEVGSCLVIKPGDQIPIDGIVIFGSGFMDESMITGEPLQKFKEEGDQVFAGAINADGYLEIKTSKKANDTTLAKIIDITYKSTQKKSSNQRFIESFAKYYTPGVMIISVLLVIIPVVFFGKPFDYWFQQALTLLIISCPCALVISTPVAIFSCIGNASAKGVVIKGGKYIEELAKIRVIAMDKTRTLTKGEPAIEEIIPLNGLFENELLACIGGMESYSEHPIAQCIVAEAKKRGLELHKHNNFKAIGGKGAKSLCASCNTMGYCIGNITFINEQADISKQIKDRIKNLEEQGKTVIVISSDEGIVGLITIVDEIKPESAETVHQLHDMAVEIVMLTGDNKSVAESLGKDLGIKHIEANLLPDKKAEKIKKLLKEYSHVAMVGDGINDAPALALSSVGIAMGAVGSDLAIDNADMALMNDKLSLIPFLIALSKKCVSIIRVNTGLAISIKIGVLALAIFGISNLSLAIVADVGVTLFVVVNSLRLFGSKEKLYIYDDKEHNHCPSC